MDILNNITAGLNKIADDITGSNKNKESISSNTGLNGLGVLNAKNESTTVNTLNNILQKVDTDKRKLPVYMNQFATVEQYCDRLRDWIATTEMFNIDVSSNEKQYIIANVKDEYASQLFDRNYKIYGCRNIDEVNNTLKHIETTQNISDNYKLIISYSNITKQQKNMAKQINVEIICANDIIEINDAIDLADKGLPYVAVGNSFVHKISRCLNNKYKNNQGNM